MTKLTFLQLAERVIQEENKPLSSAEIWQIAQVKGYDKMLASHGKTPGGTLFSALLTNVRDHRDTTIFRKIGERPARYFLKALAKSQRLQLEKFQETEEILPEILMVRRLYSRRERENPLIGIL